ncbi:uncharacterized protein N7498_000010 [Penicillium cinerascens]|uniref:Uncharacterized protein n=1 Tax=Penicillium cinerascens TaxID=70096 RepID=A0A9W9TCW7_9EURO|nr:uncharacterized protein N7498_000010 [Penicillium cinerascens]KAJ5217911.1 hypothetical protein N7498_000010 [Penicillium cinerascens]
MDQEKLERSAKYTLGVNRGPFLPKAVHGIEDHDAAVFDHVETTRSISLEIKQHTRIQKLRYHWKRFWCCYSFFGIIFLAIFLPIFFLICIPAIAQLIVDHSTLGLIEVEAMQPRPSSIMLSFRSSLKLPIGIPVRIEPFSLDLINRDVPGNNTWAKAYLPQTDVKSSAIIGIKDQHTNLDLKQWLHYINNAIFAANVPLSVKGTIESFFGKLKTHIVIDKDIEQDTFNGFKGFSIKDSTILLPALANGTNLVANVTLPNPSVMTLEVGNTVFDLKSGDLQIGNATINHLILRPGNNSSPIHGILDVRQLISNLDQILSFQAQNLLEGYLNLTTVGKSVTYDGVEVPYYTQALKNVSLTAQVALGELLINTLHNALHGNTTSKQLQLPDF